MTEQQKLQREHDVIIDNLASEMIKEFFPEFIGDKHIEEYVKEGLSSIEAIDTTIKNGLTELVEEGYIKL